ncbi:mannose-6-phosphate isomerase [Thermosipho melanesiensis]|uniref:Mannose-6-phosphate isomerase, type I n=2 Tax=Thermosipho melanesiensis TaxID=46541 RepID=A6LN79_THEM4|nr:type I phosphomannose isomerase catalytic subunit [Thermosipho melanesiensis]ABR31380.1 mannose-6-phosphate isomerase, type I [Thermosipho melanesiensis BI429]APT74440.1 mannose-6-phosphate isomerase [Thermosipho melanesiensis]OOC36402.1 mannose-6-phosphate isomerase [Thermosipho melanesiensis]OOC37220.1 mannose-6-phosphate isomerase [Thermosipho melanesiensis]OOC37972.1 mannose-6-phosphate isomerase [Thermosipho melanesiensis]
MIKVQPQFRNQIWGNRMLNNLFGINDGKIGEVWLLSGHPLFTTLIDNRSINDISKELCGKDFERFPLLIKLISTSDWLSVQVHPDDEYARSVEKEPWGKNEAWYFLTDGEIAICEEPSRLVEAFEKGNWSDVLRIEKIKKGTFVNIPAGVIHALGSNSTVIEVQQSSDLTYRIYDWGRPRETHIKKALEVSKAVKFEELIVEKINTKYFIMEYVKTSKINGFSVVVPTILEKNFGAFVIPKDSREYVENSVVIKLGEFFLNS